MRFLSLFDGCHMFGLALRRAGFECVGTSEIDTHAANVTRHHYPDTPQLGDVHNVGATRPTDPVDLIVGGFPCQDLSVAGDRCGLAGGRSGLFWEIVRIAREKSPRWILLENVSGLLSSNGGRDMGAVVGALGELGYGVAWRVLDAQHFGVPQRRRRVFIVGCLGDARRAAEVLFEPESVRGDSPPSREARPGAAGEPAKCLTAHGQRLDGETETFVVANALTRSTHLSDENSAQGGHLVALHHTQDPITGLVNPCLSHQSTISVLDEYGSQVRRLTPRECERLQGLPDDWTRYGRKADGEVYDVSDSARYKMIGNGGAVPVVEWIAQRILTS